MTTSTATDTLRSWSIAKSILHAAVGMLVSSTFTPPLLFRTDRPRATPVAQSPCTT